MTNHKNQTLTRAELQVMEVLWSIGKACDVHEVVERYAEPRPAYTTISTFMKILSTKGFVDFKKGQGKQHLYFPLISKTEYTSRVMHDVKNSFFGGSVSSFLSFFLKEEKLNREELEELIAKVGANSD
jgi:predicted transcriptional regulator